MSIHDKVRHKVQIEKIETYKRHELTFLEQNGEYEFQAIKTIYLWVDSIERDLETLKEEVFEVEGRIEKIEGLIKNAKKKAQ